MHCTIDGSQKACWCFLAVFQMSWYFFFFKASISRRESRAKEKESNLDAASLAFRRRLPARCYGAKSETTTLSSLWKLHNQKPAKRQEKKLIYLILSKILNCWNRFEEKFIIIPSSFWGIPLCSWDVHEMAGVHCPPEVEGLSQWWHFYTRNLALAMGTAEKTLISLSIYWWWKDIRKWHQWAHLQRRNRLVQFPEGGNGSVSQIDLDISRDLKVYLNPSGRDTFH